MIFYYEQSIAIEGAGHSGGVGVVLEASTAVVHVSNIAKDILFLGHGVRLP